MRSPPLHPTRWQAPKRRAWQFEIDKLVARHASDFVRALAEQQYGAECRRYGRRQASIIERVPEHAQFVIAQDAGFALTFLSRFFDADHRAGFEQRVVDGPGKHCHHDRANPVCGRRRSADDVEQQFRNVGLGNGRRGAVAPDRPGIGAQVSLVILPGRFVPLGVFEIEVTKHVEAEGLRTRLAAVALVLLRVGSGADLRADALSGLAGIGEGDGRVGAQRLAAVGGAAAGPVANGPSADACRGDAKAQTAGPGIP